MNTIMASSFAGVTVKANVLLLPLPVKVSNTLFDVPVPTATQAEPL